MKVTLVFFVAATAVLCSAHPTEQEALSRLPRSLQPGAPAPGQGSNGKDNGDGIGVDIHREKGVGTMVSGSGQQTWSSKDGKTDVRVNGQWSRIYNGPRAGGPNHRVGVSVRHRF
ncbi:uncharacterized protein DptA isoform X2 [Anabrus simplex]